jgi:ATP-dependent DNA helicase RecQ
MNSIAFIDIEVNPKSNVILDIGSIKGDGGSFHQTSIADFIQFISGTRFICGHNIIHHDVRYIGKALNEAGISSDHIIDTLYLSPLLFPTKPYHALLKDDKLQSEDRNNPLNDSIKAKDLFYDEVAAFKQADETLKQLFYILLNKHKEFHGFFRFMAYASETADPEQLIRQKFKHDICQHANLPKIISDHPVALAYCLSLIHSFIEHKKTHSITPPWVLKNYPEVERIMYRLRNQPCIRGCGYCNSVLDIHKGLKRFFGFDSYRTYGGEPLQENAVKAAVNHKSILAVFPTGGGKSITFQVPALISGEAARGLTVVISPLQSLMKDQVDNLEKSGITEAVTINGLLDPIERAKSVERVEDGSASILYISPESLRSNTILRLMLGRKIVRFVIDEAHCFSSWGQEFRVDYLYIGDFIKQLQEKKNLVDGIPVSCFTATAKQKVIEDIQDYFKEKLSLDLELYTSKTSRTNLQYTVFEKKGEEEKYLATRDLLEAKTCPTIIYVSRTLKAYRLAERLTKDGFSAKPYHGKMDKHEKSENQNSFINGDIPIMVATSAFGMGVDKKNVGMVIHFDISDSLENYVQEAGRAGRDEHIIAECYVLYNEADLDKHFILLNQTKLSIKEIQQVWKAIKEMTRFRSKVSNSALEIARKAGWDDGVTNIENRVTSAIAALEEAGYLQRGQNMPKIYANSILSKNTQEAIDNIMASEKFDQQQKEMGIRIIKKLFSSKSRKMVHEESAESRIDYIGDHLGVVKQEVITIIQLLREEHILADAKDLTAFIKRGDSQNSLLHMVESFGKIEKFLLTVFDEEENLFHIKELNEQAEQYGCDRVSTNKIKTVLNFWAIKHWIKRQNVHYSKNHFAAISLHPRAQLKEKLEKRLVLATFITKFLYKKSHLNQTVNEEVGKGIIWVEFSVHELKTAYENHQSLFKLNIHIDDIEDTLFYLSRIEAIKIDGGFMVTYNQLSIERLEHDNKKQYKVEDYQKLHQFYENKIQQIHIIGEYAQKMLNDYKDALQFVEDYFQLNYRSFLQKYFKGSRQEDIKRNLTPTKFRQLFGDLSPTQLRIINDNKTQHIVVAAGPGSGKTKLLVHKLASLLLMEDVKHEQLLMLTFSRAAATEFKKRLQQLIGNAAHYIEIKTFHSYCFDLLGKVGNIEKSGEILKKTVEKIKNGEVETRQITKTVLVIDEAQDMNEDEFRLIHVLMEQNEEMRVIAVGDDDQNIFEFRGADSGYFKQLISVNNANKHELLVNFRSKNNLVAFSNQLATRIQHRLKSLPIIANQLDNGKIKIVRHQSRHLITPLVHDILHADHSGTIGVLTKTNHESLQITGLLLKNNMPAKLVQTNDDFNLYQLLEVRFFLNQLNQDDSVSIISDDQWAKAKRKLIDTFRNSSKLNTCLNILTDFEAIHPKRKYKSDVDVFIRESKLEDFYHENRDTIVVSTIHKAKGKEFDHIYLMIEGDFPITEEVKRQLYVAITRAKRDLTVHLNSGILDLVTAENIERIADHNKYPPPKELTMHLSYKEVWLDFFINKQQVISQLQSGDELIWSNDACLNAQGQPVLRFSQSFLKTIEAYEKSQYILKRVSVNVIVYWRKEGAEHEVKIVLPEVYFEKQDYDTPALL